MPDSEQEPANQTADREQTTDKMVGSNVVAQRDGASSLDETGEEESEDYGSTGANEERSASD